MTERVSLVIQGDFSFICGWMVIIGDYQLAIKKLEL